MNGYTIQHSIDLLERNRSGAGASDVSYDNDDSGLNANNVQSAIDELASGIAEALTGAS